MLYFVLGGIGCLVGLVAFRELGWLYGVAVGLLAAEVYNLRKRLATLESMVSDRQPVVVDAPAPKEETERYKDDAVPVIPRKSAPVRPPSFAGSGAQKVELPTDGRPSVDNIVANAGNWIKRFFTTGNIMAKIGVIILFFGFSFLLKYAAQRNMVPVEFRLIGVFLVGMAMLFTGWRLRHHKPLYGLLLQGGGIGVLYLTIYAAARFYHLLPYGLAFVVMFCLVMLSGILAVLQDARSLAVSGAIGGFLAPVLMSTGSGSHVVLFSYYALLNLGILGIGWRKAWRELNLIGFVFTFGIASLWGGRYYQPRYFSSTEPFLILFFLFYVMIAVLYALRQPLKLKGYIDGTLVFGTPLVAFGLQYALVRDFTYGMAISALCLGLFYVLLASSLWRVGRQRGIEGLGMISESFLAFGVVFGSLAIPLALDGRWTSAAWALEGSAILWVGIRQNRILARCFGILLQAGAGIFFLSAVGEPFQRIPVLNSFFVGCMLISLAGFFSSWYLMRSSNRLFRWEHVLSSFLMVWGFIWWFAAAFVEIDRFVAWQDKGNAALMHAAASFLVVSIISRRLSWGTFSRPALLLLPAMGMAALYYAIYAGAPVTLNLNMNLFARLGGIAWAVAFLVQYRLLFTCESQWPPKIVSFWHQCTLWLLIFVLTHEAAHYTGIIANGGQAWRYCLWGLIPGLAVHGLMVRGDRLAWPVRRFHDAYFGAGIALPVALIFGWALLVNLYHGDPAPLPYVPVFNPVEITQFYLLFLILYWIERHKAWLDRLDAHLDTGNWKMGVYGAIFLLLNAMVARTIHFYAHVAYTGNGLYDSTLFQAAIAILWGVTALVVTLVATRKGSRLVWIAGAAILSLVVIKLFLVDLSGTGTVARIVSFLGVGSLMLMIGYFSPLPPAQVSEEK